MMQPETPGVIFGDFPSNAHYQEHLARYRFAAGLAEGKLVMDLGCGARDGPYHLAETARKVIAVDYLPAQLQEARRRYPRDGIAYVCAEALCLGLADSSFDMVASLEVIEHLEEEKQEAYLREINRLLKAGGALVISTPNREVYPEEGRARSDHHLKELSYDELEALLSRHFADVDIYGIFRGRGVLGLARLLHHTVRALDILNLRRFFSRKLRAEIYHTVARKTGGKPDDQVQTDDIDVVRRRARRAPFLIAVCRKTGR